MLDSTVLQRARAVALAYLFCRDDVARALCLLEADMAHMVKRCSRLVERFERAILYQEHEDGRVTWFVQDEMDEDQQRFVWLAFTYAYYAAAKRAGYVLDRNKQCAYMRCVLALGEGIGLRRLPSNLLGVDVILAETIGRIKPDQVVYQGWARIIVVCSSDWFRRNNNLILAEIARTIRDNLPRMLFSALL